MAQIVPTQKIPELSIPQKGKNYALRLIERLTSSLEGLPWHGFQSLDKQQIKCHMLTGKFD